MLKGKSIIFVKKANMSMREAILNTEREIIKQNLLDAYKSDLDELKRLYNII